MMTIQMFTFVMTAFCGFKDPSVTRDYKELCMEHMLNCSVHGTSDGSSTTENQVTFCKEQWIKKNERR